MDRSNRDLEMAYIPSNYRANVSPAEDLNRAVRPKIDLTS